VTGVTAGNEREAWNKFSEEWNGSKKDQNDGSERKKGRKIKRRCNKNWEIKTGRKRGKENKVGNTCSRTDR